MESFLGNFIDIWRLFTGHNVADINVSHIRKRCESQHLIIGISSTVLLFSFYRFVYTGDFNKAISPSDTISDGNRLTIVVKVFTLDTHI